MSVIILKRHKTCQKENTRRIKITKKYIANVSYVIYNYLVRYLGLMNITKHRRTKMFRLVNGIIGGVYKLVLNLIKIAGCLPLALLLLLIALLPLYVVAMGIKYFPVVLVAGLVIWLVIYLKNKNK